ncbi:MAG: HlyD family secretion protein [Methylocystaceae bacterium]|nr:MAG: HlyD family secretion protein [Methylocystaceae bacterium]KAF0212114.1 MAG: HlyD family secretion [Methylocystaceae bacterium]TXT45148.1 MAG: HlyD family secretion protein [Methylocystaceae bacterium]
MKISSRVVAILTFLCLAALGLFFLLSVESTQSTARATTSLAGVAQHVAAAPGMVEPEGEEREVAAQATGVIREMRVEENDEVAAGQIIAALDNTEQVARLESARAALALRQAELERLTNGARAEERREARDALMEADAALDLARREHERRLPLTKSGVSPQAALDQATSHWNVNKARRAAIAERLAMLEAPPRAEDLAAARARVRLAEADVALSEALLEKTLVRSPIAGTILRRSRVAGEAVTHVPPTPIAIVGNVRGLRVRADVDETDVGKIVAGQRVEVTADAFPNQKFGGRVFRVSSRMGSKVVQTGRPTDRVDAKALQVLIDLDAGVKLPVGLRVDAYFLTHPVSAQTGWLQPMKAEKSAERLTIARD